MPFPIPKAKLSKHRGGMRGRIRGDKGTDKWWDNSDFGEVLRFKFLGAGFQFLESLLVLLVSTELPKLMNHYPKIGTYMPVSGNLPSICHHV